MSTWLSFLAGLAAGAVIAAVTFGLEHSRIAFGPNERIALYGNGALIAPALGVPLAIVLGWTALLRAGSHGRGFALRAALNAVGMELGVGLAAVLDAVLYPQSAAVDPLTLPPSLLLSGVFFVAPTAVIAGLVYWAFASGRVPLNTWTLIVAFLIGLPLAPVLPGIPGGLMAGAGIAAAERARTNTATAAIALAIVVLLLLPYAVLLAAVAPPAG